MHEFSEGDLAAIVELFNMVDRHDRLGDPTNADELRRELAAPPFDPARDLRLWRGDGRLLAAGIVWLPEPADDARVAAGMLVARIHPAARQGDLAEAVFGWAEERLRAAGRERGLPALLRVSVAEHDGFSRALAEQRNFTPEQSFMRMTRPLDAPVPEPELPEGFRLRHVEDESDAAAWVAAYNETFAAHWNFQPLPLAVRLRWMAEARYRPERDLIATAPDGTLAAFCYCANAPEAADGTIGVERFVGTRPDYRRRGLGRAMTLAGLRQLQREGLRGARLTVDADNLEAVRLYESAGFRPQLTRTLYRLDL